MSICFQRIRFKNFMSYGNYFTEIPLDQKQTTLVVGKNGAGKSTFTDALSFVLYNKAFRNINKPQMINSITQKDTVVEIEFTEGPNQYLIRRGLKPAIFEIFCNQKLLNQASESKDYQKHLERNILKMNHKCFSQIVMLGSANFVPFMKLAAAARREVIEDILDIQVFSVMNSILKDRIATNKTAIRDNEYSIDVLNEKIALVRKHEEEKLLDVQTLINEKHLKITEYNIENTAVEKSIADLNFDPDAKQAIEQKLSSSEEKHRDFVEVIKKLTAKETRLVKELAFYDESHDCPKCHQEINLDFKNQCIADITTEIAGIKKGLVLALSKQEKLATKITSIKAEYQAICHKEQKAANLKGQVQINSRLIKSLMAECDALNAKIWAEDKVEDTTYQDQMKGLQSEKECLSILQSTLSNAALLLKDGGIKTKIIRQYIPIINKLINKYLQEMNAFYSFELDESFNEKIKSRFRDDFSYESFSEGEQSRINIALLLSWRDIAKMRNSSSTNLMILDEIFDSSLDVDGVENLVKILQTDKKESVFIISHKMSENPFSLPVILFEKTKNFSRIKEDVL